MLFRLHTLSTPLNNFVELITYYKGYNPPHTIEKLLPDGGIDLIIDLTEVHKYIYDNETLQEKQICKKAWISGMRTEYISIQARATESEMLIIRIKTGAAWSLLHLPVMEIKDAVVDAEFIFGKELLLFREALQNSGSPELKFCIAEKYLLQRTKNHFDIHPEILYSISKIISNPAQTSVIEITYKTGYTNKHLISLFAKYTGIGPKQYVNVLKFQQAVQMLEKDTNHINWPHLALDCGYYDQAHFINEFRKFSGFNPSAYLEARGEYMNYIPVK